MSAPDPVVIRRAEPRDLPALGQLGASLMRVHHAFNADRFLPPGDAPEVGYERFLSAQMASKDARILVADLTGPDGSTQVVGYVYAAVEPESFKELRARAGYIHDLLVSDDAQKTGVGSRLIDAAVVWLREQRVPRVLLWTAAPNERARRLFTAHGFAATMVEMTREL